MKLLYTLIIISFCFCSYIREDIIQRYPSGEKQVLVKYKGKGSSEKLIERITYSIKGDTLKLEKPFEGYVLEKSIDGDTLGFSNTIDDYRMEIDYGWDGKISSKLIYDKESLTEIRFIGGVKNYLIHIPDTSKKIENSISYSTNGIKIEESVRDFIHKKSEHKYYSLNGDLIGESSAVVNGDDGILDGIWYDFYENGNAKRRREFSENELIDTKYFNENGEEFKPDDDWLDENDWFFDVVELTTASDVEIGISDLRIIGEIIEIDIYALNKEKIAGIQLELNQTHLFEVQSVSGGRCEERDFTIRSNSEGLVLGFSMSGNMIPKSKNANPNDNVLFTIYAIKFGSLKGKIITIEPTLAGKGGAPLEYFNVPYAIK